MGPKVNRKLDVEKVDAALRRAADRAIHGTRVERSGRFLPVKKRRALPASKRRDARRRKA
jgi:hypothetical protein